MENKQNKGGGLNKSLKLIFVYTVATGSIFTFVNYWDSVFYGYCGSGTFLAFALMTVAILPVALVYSELASLFHTSGGELIYNTVGINKHVGFLASWLIMAAWISVPPAVVMAIMTWVNKTFALGLGTWQMVGCAAVLLVLYFFMSIQNVQFLVKAQAGMLFCNITVTILTGFILLFSGHWHISNFGNIFQSTLDSVYGIPGWVIGMALLITPYFGFETVPQMVEEGDFPIKSSKKAICGSILTCGCIYVFYYFCVAGLDGLKDVYTNFAQDGFLTIATMQNVLGWTFWPIIVGILSCLLGMGASLLGFWMSTVRMLYSMANKNFLPKVFAAVNKNQAKTSTAFKYVDQGMYYAYCHAWKRDANGKKVFSDWSNAYPFVVSAITPDAPVITNVKVSGSTIKVTYKAAANATGYDVVLGTGSKKENGETRPYHYGDHKVLNLKEGTVTATFKKVPKGTWVVGMHAFNRTSEDGKKVFSPWSNLKKATVK